MKKLLIILFLTFFGTKAQNLEETKTGYFVQLNPNPKGQVWVGIKSGEIEIQGDTIEAIKHLVQFIEQVQAENEEQFMCIDASVKWHNKVYDISKKGKEYTVYQKYLTKLGYKTIRKKSNILLYTATL